MSKSSKFKCPQCLSDVSVSPELAGTKTNCPVCTTTLTVPLSLGHESLFDDLFNDEASDSDEYADDTVENDVVDEVFGSNEATVDESHSETKPPRPLQVVNQQAEPEVDSVIPISDVVSKSEIEVIEEVNVGGKAGNAEVTDPFAFDENRALQIDGMSDGLLAPGSFYFKCPVCDSHMKVNENQVGAKVKCSDCYSQVVVVKPKKSEKVDQWRRPATVKSSEEDDELKLAAPVERPPVDHTISPDYGLEEVKYDLLSPVVEPERIDASATTAKPVRQAKSRAPDLKVAGQPIPRQRVQPGAKNQAASNEHRAAADDGMKQETIGLDQLLKFDFSRDFDFMLRTAVTVVFLTLFYSLAESVWNTLQLEGLNGGEKFVIYLPTAVGSFICFLLSSWFISVTFSVLMRSVANGRQCVDEWVGFAPSEWMGSFLIFAISSWVALLPGVLFGYVAMKVTGLFLFFPLFGGLSFCLLLPIVLTSAFVNESVYNVYSPHILGSLTKDADSWLSAYKLFLIPAAVFLFGILIVFLPGLIFSFIGAGFQVAGITLYAILIGMQARVVTAGLLS